MSDMDNLDDDDDLSESFYKEILNEENEEEEEKSNINKSNKKTETETENLENKRYNESLISKKSELQISQNINENENEKNENENDNEYEDDFDMMEMQNSQQENLSNINKSELNDYPNKNKNDKNEEEENDDDEYNEDFLNEENLKEVENSINKTHNNTNSNSNLNINQEENNYNDFENYSNNSKISNTNKNNNKIANTNSKNISNLNKKKPKSATFTKPLTSIINSYNPKFAISQKDSQLENKLRNLDLTNLIPNKNSQTQPIKIQNQKNQKKSKPKNLTDTNDFKKTINNQIIKLMSQVNKKEEKKTTQNSNSNNQFILQEENPKGLNSSNTNKSKVKKRTISAKQKLEVEKEIYFKTLKNIKSNFELFGNKQTKTRLSSTKKKDIVNLNNKIPMSYENIDNNKELVRLLLKNPQLMTIQEKVFLNGLNEEEFKRIISYLKVKNKELGWRGNDLGSGHFNDLYIKIDRNTETYLNDRYMKLKNFLKLNFNNVQAEEYLKQTQLDEEMKKKTEDLRLRAQFDGVVLDQNFYDDEKVEKDKVRVEKFVSKTRDIMKELDHFKLVITDHRSLIESDKMKLTNNQIYRDLDHKINFMKDDVKKMKNLKGKYNEKQEEDYFLKFEEFKQKNKKEYENFLTNLSKSFIISKMKAYCVKRKLNTINFVNTLNNALSYDDTIDLNVVRKNLIKFSILDEEEAAYFIKLLSEYKNEVITSEFLACLLDEQLREQIINGKFDRRKFMMPKDEYDLEDYLNEEEDDNDNNNYNNDDDFE